MTITVHRDIDQGSPAWHEVRRGVFTASNLKNLITPSELKPSKSRRPYLLDLLSQRITKYVEPSFINDDMERGYDAEEKARTVYADAYDEPIERIGFITNDALGFLFGYSPDFGLVSGVGGGEVKGPRAKGHLETILANAVPVEHGLQLQGGLFASGWSFIDFISFHEGLPMFTLRVYPDPVMQEAIGNALVDSNKALALETAKYDAMMASPDFRLVPTVRDDMRITE